MRACPVLLCGLAAIACSRSGSDNSAPVLAAATIGPEGGVVAIDSGLQAGLRLVVPPGALKVPTEIRVRDVSLEPAPGTFALSYAVPPAAPFRLEPVDLRLEELATLRAPYTVRNVHNTAPGNVRLRQVRGVNVIDYEPTAVNVVDGWIEVPLRTLAQCSVVAGERVGRIDAYWQPRASSVALDDGYSFHVEDAPAGSPFTGTNIYRWRISGPGVEDLIYFDNNSILGRESNTDGWRETWYQSYPAWDYHPASLPPGSFSTIVGVSAPMNLLPISGQMTAVGQWSWGAPREVLDRVLLDNVNFQLTLAWNRHDIGLGQRDYSFWFAPGIGLLAFSQDGVVRSRLAF